MVEPTNATAEVELWNALMRAKQNYTQSLASLDALVLDSTNSTSLPPERCLVEEIAQLRRLAYTKYRQAMDDLTEYLRK